MNRLALSMIWLSSTLSAPALLAGQAPITSKSALTHYLHDMPAGSSPLDRLSPGGRKRFLAQLKFGKRGLGGFSSDDPENELTHRQIVQLYALFGVEGYAEGLGLTDAEQSGRQRERMADAKARSCAVASCPESDIEQSYDALVLQKSNFSMPDAQRFALTSQRYDRLFSSYQSPETLHLTSAPDLRLLQRAADNVVFSSPSAAHIAELQADLAEMQHRGMAVDGDYAGLYRALIAGRQFAEADTLAQQHSGMGVGSVPALRPETTLPAGWPTALTVGEQGRTMTREAFDLSTPLRIVVVASCHFSQDAARAIAADAQLRPLFADHAIWLASQREPFDAAVDWNRQFPDQPIRIAWQDSEWSMLDSWSMPTFYVFRDGKLARKWAGWSGLPSLRQSLREAGALR